MFYCKSVVSHIKKAFVIVPQMNAVNKDRKICIGTISNIIIIIEYPFFPIERNIKFI